MSELRLYTDVKTGEPVKKELTDEKELKQAPYLKIEAEDNGKVIKRKSEGETR